MSFKGNKLCTCVEVKGHRTCTGPWSSPPVSPSDDGERSAYHWRDRQTSVTVGRLWSLTAPRCRVEFRSAVSNSLYVWRPTHQCNFLSDVTDSAVFLSARLDCQNKDDRKVLLAQTLHFISLDSQKNWYFSLIVCCGSCLGWLLKLFWAFRWDSGVSVETTRVYI